jgi:hypothetical protein
MPEAKPHQSSCLKAVLIGAVIFGGLLFMVTAMNTGDLLWFWPVFKEVPVDITVHCYGKDVQVNPGQPAFEVVNGAVNSSLTGVKRWDDLSMSNVTYQEYQTSPTMMVIELSYDPPARIHSQYAFFKNVNKLIIPLDGRHALANPIFGRTGEFTNSGSYHVKSTAPIVTALQEQGICTKP